MDIEYYDTLIIGAGLSGVGTACHLQKNCPNKTFVMIEQRQAIGGTWDYFRYPGVRSDSDIFTLGFRFNPWKKNDAIVSAEQIRDYIQDTAQSYKLQDRIKFGHRVVHANWDSKKALWWVTIQDLETGNNIEICSSFIINCSGYYRYDKGYMPDFEGIEDFQGEVLHPQSWPEDYSAEGKKVVVIGSGATAMTLVPALADKAQQVTMLQRSPTYVLSMPKSYKITKTLKRFFPEKLASTLNRGTFIFAASLLYQYCRRFPNSAKKYILDKVKRQLPDDFDMRHFTPNYQPWDERLCFVPRGDLFKAIRNKKADVVTDHIDRFTETGILLKSGQHIEADTVVSATGLNLLMLGGASYSVDHQPIDFHSKMIYRNLMFEDIPNFAMMFGYTNISYTLRIDINADWLCGLYKHMDSKGFDTVLPQSSAHEVSSEPMISLQSGYIQRSQELMPKQGKRWPWRLSQNFILDTILSKFTYYKDKRLSYSSVKDRFPPFTKKSEFISTASNSNSTDKAETTAIKKTEKKETKTRVTKKKHQPQS